MDCESRDTIYFSDDWVLPKYLGWKTRVKNKNAVVLTKRLYFLSKMLVFTCDLNAHDVDNIIKEIPHNKLLTIIHWRNLTDSSEDLQVRAQTLAQKRILLGSCWYNKALDSNKALHWATYVLNLEKEVDEIMVNMSATVRNECRRAQKKGVVVSFEDKMGDWINEFYKFYKRLQYEFRLPIPDRKLLEMLFAGRNAVAVVGRDSDGISAINIVYLAQPYAYYMLGASSNSKERGLGQLMQLETITYLKANGYKRYDLGGINPEQPGIVAFKKSFGGDFCDLGTEWVYMSKPVDVLIKLRSLITHARSFLMLPARTA